jgi:hypothetical protein
MLTRLRDRDSFNVFLKGYPPANNEVSLAERVIFGESTMNYYLFPKFIEVNS